MIRIAASCETIPDNVLGIPGKVQEAGGRYIKRVCNVSYTRLSWLLMYIQRCEQFSRLSQGQNSLKAVMARAKSCSVCFTNPCAPNNIAHVSEAARLLGRIGELRGESDRAAQRYARSGWAQSSIS